MSVDPSVLSEGSPGSVLFEPFGTTSFSCVDDRNRLEGGFFAVVSGAVDSPPSSPDASLDEGCSWSIAAAFLVADGRVLVLFRLPDPDDDGEDIWVGTVMLLGRKCRVVSCSIRNSGFVPKDYPRSGTLLVTAETRQLRVVW